MRRGLLSLFQAAGLSSLTPAPAPSPPAPSPPAPAPAPSPAGPLDATLTLNSTDSGARPFMAGHPIGALGVISHSAIYDPVFDCIFVFGGNPDTGGTLTTTILDCSSGTSLTGLNIAVPTRQMPYGGRAVGAAKVPRLAAIYFYEGRQSSTCEVLAFSTTNIRTTTFNWRRESFTGPTPPGVPQGVLALNGDGWYSEVYDAWRKWGYSPATDCLIWTDGISGSDTCQDGLVHDGIVQAWRPPGTVI
ncbi:MAG: hypothetical protein IIZ92_02140 [Aquincola sp.]|nr:hypothetical protein [Aquincola sp.]